MRYALTNFAVLALAHASFGVVLDHSMNPFSAPKSDTGVSPGGVIPGKKPADVFVLKHPAIIRHITWWGFHLRDVAPVTETMRIRFYDARASDGLPGTVLFEENSPDPYRIATGIVDTVLGGPAAELRFEWDLSTPVSLEADTPYWFEVVQLGDTETRFLWRGANVEETGRAVMETGLDWTLHNGFDMAFQLSTIPEPSALILFILGIGFICRKTNQ